MTMQLRPSAAPIWTKCAAMPRLAAQVPDVPPSDPAREGTCAAWLAEMMLSDQPVETGIQHPENGWVVDNAMIHHINGYVEMLRSYGGRIDVERRVRLNTHIAGTPDAFAVLTDGTLRVDDLKYGYVPVEATTPQVTIYAGAILRHMMARGPVVRKVVLGIYQPRAYHPSGVHRTVAMFPEELLSKVHRIEAAGEKCLSDDATATPGTHCRYCPAAGICSAVAHVNYETLHHMHHAQARNRTVAELAEELAFVANAEAMLKGVADAVRAEANARMDRGENIPGWMREQGYGQRRWNCSPAMIEMATGLDPTSGKMVTPAELERRGADHETLALLTETPRTAAKLRPVPDGYYERMFK